MRQLGQVLFRSPDGQSDRNIVCRRRRCRKTPSPHSNVSAGQLITLIEWRGASAASAASSAAQTVRVAVAVARDATVRPVAAGRRVHLGGQSATKKPGILGRRSPGGRNELVTFHRLFLCFSSSSSAPAVSLQQEQGNVTYVLGELALKRILAQGQTGSLVH